MFKNNFWYIDHDLKFNFITTLNYLGLLDSLEKTVNFIMKNSQPPFNIMVSGGIDSQVMLYAWNIYGKNFIPTSVKYNNDLNNHDLITLIEFAKQENISINYINFDLLDFYNGKKFQTICHKYKCISPQFAAHLGMIENLEGTCIFGGDRLFYSGSINFGQLCYYRASKEMSLIPSFYLHTPELAYSQLYQIKNENIYEWVLKVTQDPFNNKNQIKHLLFNAAKIPFVKPVAKYTGFEEVKKYYDKNFYVSAKQKLKYAGKLGKSNYDLLLRYPFEELYGIPYQIHSKINDI